MSNTPCPLVILLAEDEPADAHMVKTALSENRILTELHHVFDGREVLQYLRRQGSGFADAPRPHLILLDLNMPRMNGHECLAALKQDQALRDIPVVILTTSEIERDIVASYHLGAVGFITKPVDVMQFIKTIGAMCNYWITQLGLPGHPTLQTAEVPK